MRSKKEIKKYLDQLREQGYDPNSVSMLYEHRGAIQALQWVLEPGSPKPYVYRRE